MCLRAFVELTARHSVTPRSRPLELSRDLEEVSFPMATCVAVQQAWPQWLAAAGSLEAAGEGFFTQLFDSAPSLQSSFRSPKAIISMRFMTALGQIVALLGNASALKKEIEALAFKHLEIEVSSVKVAFFREAMLEVLDDALEEFSPAARVGFHALVNYMGGAIMFIRREYAGRIRTILSSWAAVNSKGEELELEAEAEAEAEAQEEKEQTEPKDEMDEKLEPETDWTAMAEKDLPPSSRKQEPSVDGDRRQKMQIPTNFNEMLLFNASVMGFGDSLWMKIVLTKFDDMVKNVANFSRLQEECDVMSLLLAKYQGQIQLSEFKAVTLASLRSLLPQRWDSDHELAWTWLWENVENLLSAMLGKPAMQAGRDSLGEMQTARM
ncbi:unnamed protein product [Effrenium voratum]|nr:unnamed protein product [Effrenium voratum]